MWRKTLIPAILLVAVMAAVGCQSTQAPVKTAAPAPPPLSERLDALYAADSGAWANQMKTLLTQRNPAIPRRHLVAAVKRFNTPGNEQYCLAAAHLFIEQTAGSARPLDPDERRLVSEYMEYVLRNPDKYSMEEVRRLCRLVGEDNCFGR